MLLLTRLNTSRDASWNFSPEIRSAPPNRCSYSSTYLLLKPRSGKITLGRFFHTRVSDGISRRYIRQGLAVLGACAALFYSSAPPRATR
jgi:hypothetical protein